MNETIDAVRFVIGLCLLSYAAYTDLKTREASDKIWLIMGIAGIILLLIERPDVMQTAISIAIAFPLALLLYVFGMGGADVKAMWSIALLSPLQPSFYGFPFFSSPIFVFPLTFLINSLLLVAFLPLFFLLYNATKKDISFPQCLFGYRMEAEKAKKTFVWSMERNDGSRGIMPVKDFNFEKAGNRKIWVTPQMPFLLFMSLGFFISYVFGDILFFLLSFLH
ncbi:MAG: prepilin peptidase [Thermoplasmata archaeon]|nr:prepilin peptidase [Thermoplasmata archaeon]